MCKYTPLTHTPNITEGHKQAAFTWAMYGIHWFLISDEFPTFKKRPLVDKQKVHCNIYLTRLVSILLSLQPHNAGCIPQSPSFLNHIPLIIQYLSYYLTHWKIWSYETSKLVVSCCIQISNWKYIDYWDLLQSELQGCQMCRRLPLRLILAKRPTDRCNLKSRKTH